MQLGSGKHGDMLRVLAGGRSAANQLEYTAKHGSAAAVPQLPPARSGGNSDDADNESIKDENVTASAIPIPVESSTAAAAADSRVEEEVEVTSAAGSSAATATNNPHSLPTADSVATSSSSSLGIFGDDEFDWLIWQRLVSVFHNALLTV